MTLTMLRQGCLFVQIGIPVVQAGPGRYLLHLFDWVKVTFLLIVGGLVDGTRKETW